MNVPLVCAHLKEKKIGERWKHHCSPKQRKKKLLKDTYVSAYTLNPKRKVCKMILGLTFKKGGFFFSLMMWRGGGHRQHTSLGKGLIGEEQI